MRLGQNGHSGAREETTGEPAVTADATFAPVPVSARECRRFLRSFLAERRVAGDGAHGAELALSEVVTNAVLHAHTEFTVEVWLEEEGLLRVEVTDGNPQLPLQRNYAEQATTGRGMELVAAHVQDCGVLIGGHEGKTVWFTVDLQARPDDLSETELLDAWDIEIEIAAPDRHGEHIVLLDLPPTLWLAAREHHDAVLREYALFSSEHPDEALPVGRVALADQARSWISTRLVEALQRRAAAEQAGHRLLPAGHPSPLPDAPPVVDLHVPVPADAAGAFSAMQDVLDAAEALAIQGRLLSRPGLLEIVAIRDWACEQAISQLAGIAP